jgi:PiT family inorganic phosphate transporter
MHLLAWIFRRFSPALVTKIFNRSQVVSAACMAFSRGNNDAKKTTGIITMALVSYYQLPDFHVFFWVIFLCAGAMGVGTAFGGWRIIKTVGARLINLRPIRGFAAETSDATVIEVASCIGLPRSITHIISSTIMGEGASKRLSAVRWGVGGNIALAWVITLPACTVLAWAVCKVVLFLL